MNFKSHKIISRFADIGYLQLILHTLPIVTFYNCLIQFFLLHFQLILGIKVRTIGAMGVRRLFFREERTYFLPKKQQKAYYFSQKSPKHSIFGRPRGARAPLAPSGRPGLGLYLTMVG